MTSRHTLFAAIVLAVVGGASLAAAAPPPLDHYTCYKARETSGSVRFPGIPVPPGVTLEDRFGTSTVAVKKPKFLCAPTDKLGEDPSAPAHPEHLKGYQIKPTAKPSLPAAFIVFDQFNPVGLSVDLKNPSHLMLPSAKSLSATPPTPPAFTVDHFQCYKVRVSSGTRFTPVSGVTLEDQFGSMTVDVKKPTFLCAPVDKNGGSPGAENRAGYLTCYQVKQTSIPKFTKRTGVFVNNQFGPETLDVIKPADLCVPARLEPICGDDVRNRPEEECDGADDAACPGQCGAADGFFACLCTNIPRQRVIEHASTDLDIGWKGLSHDSGVPEGAGYVVDLYDCDNVTAVPRSAGSR